MTSTRRRVPESDTVHGTSSSMSIVLALLGFSVFINYIDRGNLSIAAPMLKDELGMSPPNSDSCSHPFSGPTRSRSF
jgi:hypothetical protein